MIRPLSTVRRAWRGRLPVRGATRRVFIGLLIASAALLSVPVSAQPVEIPTQFCRGFFFVPVQSTQRDPTPERTLWFLFDTGATTTWVDREALQRLTGRLLAPDTRVALTDAAAGPVRFNRLRARVRDLDYLSLILGRQIDGILAFRTFRDYLLTLDYASQRLLIEPGELPRPDERSVFSARGPDHRPWLELRVGGHARRLLIDSGASGGFALNAINQFRTLAPPRPAGAVMKIDGLHLRHAARLHGNVVMGPHRFLSPIVDETDDTELLGAEVMEHFIWTFDQQRRRVRIARHGSGRLDWAPMHAHGMVLAPRDDVLQVEAIIPGSPAARADLRVGDLVTHLNGRPLTDRGCRRETDSATMSVTRTRALLLRTSTTRLR